MKFLFIWSLVLGLSLHCEAQNLKGKVKEQNGEGIPGVAVAVEGGQGTFTDIDGNFTLNNIKKGDKLIFSFIGYETQEVIIANQTDLQVTMANAANELEEIVVVGYGTQNKKEVTGAVSVISSETIQRINPVRVEQALQGQVAGVNITSQSGSPGSGSTINIRGISTNGDSRPLILVDGNVIEDLSVINPQDIESVNVLKDATAGIYGVRAANGVILIVTKSGRLNTKMKFDLTTYYGVQSTTRKIPVLNATEYALLKNESFTFGGSRPPFRSIEGLGVGTDWQDLIFQNAPIYSLNLGMNGGKKKSKYSAGVSYLDQDGIVGGSSAKFQRITTRGNYTYDFSKKLKVNVTGLYLYTDKNSLLENSLGSVLFNALNMAPTLPIRDSNGSFTLAEGLGNEVINPAAQINDTYNSSQVNKISGTLGITYNVLKNLEFNSRFQFNHAVVDGQLFSPEAFYGSGKVFNVARSAYTENQSVFQDYTWDNYLTYSTSFGGSHNVKAMLGSSVFKTIGEFASSTGFNIPDNSIGNATLDNVTDVIDNFQNGNNMFDSRLLSYFTRVQYDFKGKYLLSAVLRRDGSTKFGPKNQFGYFPSISAGWNVSDEAFFKNITFVNQLKLRASYGIVGNDRIADYGFVSLLNGEGVYVFNNDLVFGRTIGRLNNPEIQWEEQKTLDIGFDAKFGGNKWNLTMDYFKKRTEKLLLVAEVSGILGASAPGSSPPITNAGTVDNQGLEFQLGYVEQLSKNFSVNASFNATRLVNNVLFVNSEGGFLAGGSFGVGQEPPSRMEVGQSIGYFYGYKTNGIFQTASEVAESSAQQNATPGDLKFVDTNNDGIIDASDRTNIGSPIPDIVMGFNIGFDYKNIDFSCYTFASVGNEIVRNYERNQPLTNFTAYAKDRWTGEGSTNVHPKLSTGTNSNILFSDYFVEDGSYVRVQNVQLGYTVGQNWKNITKCRIYVLVVNPVTLTKYTGYDPSASSGAPIGGGIDQGFYPLPRTYQLGLNLNF
jgi:TonB-linked SusC/RagA family outer membrane protein